MRRNSMPDMIPVKIEETNIEVLAMIVKATSQKFDCSMDIDFQNGNRKVEFIGDEIFKPLIIEEVESILTKKEGRDR
jgi:hypothetical protein